MFNFILRLFYPVWSLICFGVETILGKRKREFLVADINENNNIMDLSSSPELPAVNYHQKKLSLLPTYKAVKINIKKILKNSNVIFR